MTYAPVTLTLGKPVMLAADDLIICTGLAYKKEGIPKTTLSLVIRPLAETIVNDLLVQKSSNPPLKDHGKILTLLLQRQVLSHPQNIFNQNLGTLNENDFMYGEDSFNVRRVLRHAQLYGAHTGYIKPMFMKNKLHIIDFHMRGRNLLETANTIYNKQTKLNR